MNRTCTEEILSRPLFNTAVSVLNDIIKSYKNHENSDVIDAFKSLSLFQ